MTEYQEKFSLSTRATPYVIMIASSAGGDQFTYRVALRRKFFFVFGHDISFIHGWIMVQITGGGIKMPAVGSFDFLE